jgi:hypothetical protein
MAGMAEAADRPITATTRSAAIRPGEAALSPSRLRRAIESLGPYPSLALLLVPSSLVEPLKLIAVAFAGEGHRITGTVMIVAAYAASLLVVERLFRVVKPKLLQLPWFARLWHGFVAIRGRIVEAFS